MIDTNATPPLDAALPPPPTGTTWFEPPRAPYPIRFDVHHPGPQRRLTNVPIVGTLVRIVLLVPHFLILWLLTYVQFLAYFMATFVILFRGRYPRGLFKLQVGMMRWQANLAAYYLHLYDEYPPLDLDHRADRPLRLEVDYPTHPSRWLNSPFLGMAIKLILLVPHFFILYAFWFLAGVVVLLGQFIVLFSHTFPLGMHQLVVGYLRWGYRVNGYMSGFTDRYPPFDTA